MTNKIKLENEAFLERLTLCETENKRLKSQISELESKLEELNDNTVVQSMNDMKKRYEDVVQTSVCSCIAEWAKYAYDSQSDTLRCVHKSLSILEEDLEHLPHCIEHQLSASAKKKIENSKTVITHLLRIISNTSHFKERLPFPKERCFDDCESAYILSDEDDHEFSDDDD